MIDYGAGNLFSIAAACRRLGYDVTITSDPEIIEQGSRVIFPGVGNAGAAREALDRSQLAGLIPQLKMPVLGICLGMQMMTRRSDEGDTAGLSIFSCDVKEFNSEAAACFNQPGRSVDSVSANEPHSESFPTGNPRKKGVSGNNDLLKVPHMGWNRAYELKGPLFKGISEGAWLYFVHSFYAPMCEQSAAITSYGIPFSAALWHDNFFGCQFHPEKSGETGIHILKNFLEL
ncbi:MAG: imidazole glycerol phosphate synthase subunit HisH [Bacteroidales bacterium]|nr:imidazole glycerol phosphate synthase subunit HisH [Bacteroidales bacterium]